ncbi:MAG: GTP-binding protein [Bacteroidaceae bacterium]|nr:GTP-binding protein [Bacteroidaceae bacterium]
MEKVITPVLLITGYLGSGKTTLLNRILQNKKGIKFAVIVNDIGEVNIDADLIEKGGIVDQQDDSLVALQNGCICCSLKMDLVEQLQDIIALHRFDYIVVEASGICEPAPIAQTICSIPQMEERYTDAGVPVLDCIVSVVDALRLKDEFQGGLDLLRADLESDDIENLVIQQIEFCNMVLLNKAAEVTPEELGRIRQLIRTLQPKAEIVECNYGDVNLDKLLCTGLFDFEATATSAKWVEALEEHADEEHHHEGHHHHDGDEEEHDHHHHHHDGEADEHRHHDGEHHHHEHPEGCTCGHCHDHNHGDEYGISTFVYYRRRPFNMGIFDHFVAKKWPKSVIRAKGICYFKNEEEMCYLFEQAGKQVSLKGAGQWYATMPADELEEFLERNPGVKRDWDDEVGDRMQKLVFIGQHMDKEEIARELDACLM